jgi:serine/threonine protein kinase/cytochrome c-type biogenesis protein CcmH/NrfG
MLSSREPSHPGAMRIAMHCPACSQVVSPDAVRCSHCQADLGEITHFIHEVLHTTAPALLEFQPGTVFSDRFLIVEKAAVGGMSVVYKARDRDLGGEVALKLLPPALAGRPDFVQRFRREVKVAREINHPNVCRVYDHGSYRGTLFFFMEWVKGETLRDLLRKSGKLDQRRALEIAEKIALGLEAAHSRGIVHRDVKPGNVMIDDRGEVRVLDFGVAGDTEHELTDIYPVPVTPRYTAPEQEIAHGEVDHRTDLFALGLVLQEMLTGNPRGPATGRTASIVNRLCAPNPDDRYQTAAAAAHDIATLRDRLGSHPKPRGWSGLLTHKKVRAAGLMFAVSLGVVGAYVGIKEWITPNSMRLYEKAEKIRLDAETIPKWNDAIQTFYLSALADTNNALAWAGMGETYWTRYERTKDPLSRDEAEHAVSRALRIDPRLPKARLAQAHGLIAVGKAEEAKKVLLALVKDEPKVDQEWALLGRAYQQTKQKDEGLKALQRAVALSPKSWRTHLQLGQYHKRNQDYANAEREFRIAQKYKPKSPTAWLNLGGVLLLENQTLEALTALETGVKYDPTAATYSNLGTAYYHLKNYPMAADRYAEACRLEPDNPTYAANLGDALRMMGKSASADSAYAAALQLGKAVLAAAPEDVGASNSVTLMYARLRDTADALAMNIKMLQHDANNADALFNRAVICAVVGKDDEAADWLAKGIHVGLGKAQISNDPDLARLQGQPRFEDTVALAR